MKDLPFAVPSPIQEIFLERLKNSNIEFFIKRDDLIHPEVSGNKWRKLQLNFEQARFKGKDTVLTFGGAFSNHIVATAKAAQIFNLKSIGIIRGKEADLENPTLRKAAQNGMTIHRISRTVYREKESYDFKNELHELFGDFYLIPEGGANFYGVQGCMDIMNEIPEGFDRIFLGCGTGTTLAGMALNNPNETHLTGVSALKGDFLIEAVKKQITAIIGDSETENDLIQNVEVLNQYHFGGYAKTSPDLFKFMDDFESETKIKLDGIYSAKAMFAMIDQALSRESTKREKWLFLHTGGLQGNQSLRVSSH